MRRHGRAIAARGQSGIALILVLLLLLIVTLIGLAAMRGTLLQERMAGNTAARGNAFQLAEAILREGEAIAATAPTMPPDGGGCSNGLCENPDNSSDGAWQTASNFHTSSLQPPSGAQAGYLIEDMGVGSEVSPTCTTAIDIPTGDCTTNVRHYRITARVHTDVGTEVVLQSSYQVE